MQERYEQSKDRVKDGENKLIKDMRKLDNLFDEGIRDILGKHVLDKGKNLLVVHYSINYNDDEAGREQMLDDYKARRIKLLAGEHRNDYKKLCKHIAKARIVADYIASMTDRYAEKKYNEIVSSNTVWS